mmetsp:Transcript_14896/g.30195  ORF Transcript_14896/g.30195 Transcript_14896/m.30195 type:complete len:110 (+) Transcript_14896:751-1080(+)
MAMHVEDPAQSMAVAHTRAVRGRMDKIDELTRELAEAQQAFISLIVNEKDQFTPIKPSDFERISKTFAKIPRYQKKVLALSRRMKLVSQRVFKLKIRARELLEAQKASE